jgi:sulfite reductase (NADPH) hemoprotein beta-component
VREHSFVGTPAASENVGEDAILAVIERVLAHYARDRRKGERLGDFTIRARYVAEVREGRRFKD